MRTIQLAERKKIFGKLLVNRVQGVSGIGRRWRSVEIFHRNLPTEIYLAIFSLFGCNVASVLQELRTLEPWSIDGGLHINRFLWELAIYAPRTFVFMTDI